MTSNTTGSSIQPGSVATESTASAAAAAGPTLLLTPLRGAVPAEGGTLELLIRVQAPAAPALQQRAPLRLSLVVDRSGSMDGQPLTEALRCVNHIAERLLPTDQLAVVLYDHQIQIPFPLHPANQAAAVAQTLARIDSGGSTDLFGGWQAGARQLEAADPVAISRVLLLSDGQANHGLTDVSQIADHCAQWLTQGVSTSTVGLGQGFNEDLMIAMARAGAGQQYYGQSAEDLFDGFDEELALLQALYARQLQIKLLPGEGVIIEALGLVQRSAQGHYVLTDLAWGAESWMLVRLHLTPAATTAARTLLGATLECTPQGDAAAPAVLSLSFPVLTLPVLDAAACAALAADATVAARLLEVQFGDQTLQVRELLRQGDMAQAQQLLERLATQVADHPWLRDKLQSLRELTEQDALMAEKELLFGSHKMHRRQVAVNEVAYSVGETESTTVPSFLRRKVAEGKGRRKNPPSAPPPMP